MTPREVYILLQAIGIVVLIGELVYVTFQKPSNLQRHLIFILYSLAVSFVGYLIELIPLNMDGTYAGVQVAYIGVCLGYAGKPFALVASALLLFEYVDIKLPKWLIFSVLAFFGFLTIMVCTNWYPGCTNPYTHKLYYTDIGWDPNANLGSPLTINGRGPFWYVYMASAFVIYGAYIILTFYEFRRSKTNQAKKMAIMLFLTVFFSVVGLLLYITKSTYSYDSTLLGILIGTIPLLILLTKYRIFDSITLARHKALSDSKDGIIILDARMTVSYKNTIAKSIFPEFGTKEEGLMLDKILNYQNGKLFFANERVYELRVRDAFAGKRQVFVGKTLAFNDITEHYNYKERLEVDVDKAILKIKNIQRSTLASFADLVEARDGNTGEHIKSVSNTTEKIAIELAKNPKYEQTLTSEYIKILKECAPLHDIGKIFVPDAILLKPGKLTPEEYEIIKTHAQKGREICENSLKDIEEPIYTELAMEISGGHHEWWNGKGYPKGLKEEEIPLSARIIAVADVYDALRMERSYKKAYSKEESIRIIQEETGSHFDPTIVEAFLKIVDSL